jgi:hypothetical protein
MGKVLVKNKKRLPYYIIPLFYRICQQKMSKTLKEFQELDGWSESLDRFAEEACAIKDCPSLKESALAYLKAEEAFRKTMEQFDVEMG